jgi:hypothetical protein
MPKKPARKATTHTAAEPSPAKPGRKPSAKKAEPRARSAGGNTAVVHSCIRGCAGHNNFGPNDQLKNIPADAQCVQTCVIDSTGKPVLVSDTDTENDIVGML